MTQAYSVGQYSKYPPELVYDTVPSSTSSTTNAAVDDDNNICPNKPAPFTAWLRRLYTKSLEKTIDEGGAQSRSQGGTAHPPKEDAVSTDSKTEPTSRFLPLRELPLAEVSARAYGRKHYESIIKEYERYKVPGVVKFSQEEKDKSEKELKELLDKWARELDAVSSKQK